eukprot:3139058-Lingulodinium_polyedra.AAC.1
MASRRARKRADAQTRWYHNAKPARVDILKINTIQTFTRRASGATIDQITLRVLRDAWAIT